MDAVVLASIPHAVWSAFAFAAGWAIIAGAFPHLRRAFRQWQLDRRLARDSFILREEFNRYQLAIGEELPPLRPWRHVSVGLITGALAGLPVWLALYGLEDWWDRAWLAVLALVLLYGFWRWLNDPDSQPLAESLPSPRVALVAVAGTAGALVLTGAILLAIAFL